MRGVYSMLAVASLIGTSAAFMVQERRDEGAPPTTAASSAPSPESGTSAGAELRRRGANVLLVTLCSVRADHLSCYGYARATTPNLEELAKRSVVFERAITPWPKTGPAIAALMTGKYGHTNGVMRVTPRRRLAEEQDTVAEILKRNGYATAGFSTSAALNESTNSQQGLDEYKQRELDRKQRAESTTEDAVAWLRRRAAKKNKPFFLWVHYNNAHTPYMAPGAEPDMFVDDAHYDGKPRIALSQRDELDLPVPEDTPYRGQILRGDVGGVHPNDVLSPRSEERSFYIARYDAGVFACDRAIGRLCRALQRLKLDENTVIVVVSDHGESFDEQNYYCAHGRFPYESTAHVPLIIRPAGGTTERRVAARVSTLGMAATVLDLVGIEPPKDMEVGSLLAVAAGGPPPAHVFMESGFQMDYTLSVYEGPWKLVHVSDPIDRKLMKGVEFELYNLEKDPGESTNLYDREPQTAAKLRGVLEEWSRPWIAKTFQSRGTEVDDLDEETLEKLRSLGYVP